MKNKHLPYLSVLLLSLVLPSCSKDKDIPYVSNSTKNKINTVTQFVYDGLSTYYFWADEVVSKKPTEQDLPKPYFYKALNTSDTEHGWSWITDNVDELNDSFDGVDVSFGYELAFTLVGNQPFAYVKYVYPNSPADLAGIKRLDFIGKLNGNNIKLTSDGKYIDQSDINILYGANTVNFSIYNLTSNGLVFTKDIPVTPNNSGKDPVIYKNIYKIGGKKIAYLFYSSFIDNFNESLYKAFEEFNKNGGVTDLILDLRYNRGGAVSSAIYLSSMIAPRAAVESKSPFIIMKYNPMINKLFDDNKWDRKDYLGDYNDKKYSNPLNANLDLKKVYIIATSGSYSASELTTFCLKPYMEVIHIGTKTGGKYTASWTIHAFDKEKGIPIYGTDDITEAQKTELKNWAMQPIVAVYSNKNEETFINPGYLQPNYEFVEGFGSIANWTQIGDTKDVLLGEALYLITQDSNYKPVEPTQTRAFNSKVIIRNNKNQAIPVIDDIKLTPEKIKKLQELKNR